MERLTQRVKEGILVKESHGENSIKTLYQCFGDNPNENYSNCEEGYCAMEKLADYEDAEEHDSYGKWIPVSERLPEERNSIFAKYKGTDKWESAMFVKISETVIATVEYPSGEMITKNAHTVDGIWKLNEGMLLGGRVVAWMPLPEPYRESEEQK